MVKFQRTCVFLLALLLIFALSACQKEDLTVYTVTKEGISYTVDRENCTISDGKHTYRYTFEGNASTYNVTIHYPNGASYWWEGTNFGGYGGNSSGYDESLYASGEVLTEILEEKAPKPPKSFAEILGGLIFLGFGILFAAKPEVFARRRVCLWVKNAEPSDFAISMYRISGVFMIIASVVLLII